MATELNRPAGPARVLVVNPSPVRGGAERLLLDLVTRFERTTVVVASLADGPFPDEVDAAGITQVRLRAGRLRHIRSWWRTVRALRRLAADADVVLSWQVKGHYYGTPAARLARRPAAWWDHGIRPARREHRSFVDRRLPAMVRADVVVCSSRLAASRHRAALAIHPGVPLEPFEGADRAAARIALGAGDGERLVGVVGRLQPWKGQHVFLAAGARVAERHPEARFVVIGGAIGGFDEGYPAELCAYAERLGIAGRTAFLGHRDDVQALLPGLDVCVLASFEEPFGITVVEAMAAGVPVVATGAGGVPEIIREAREGLLVHVGDHGAMAEAISLLLDDPAVAGTIAAAARRRAREAFSIERCVREVEDLVWSLAREGRT